MTEFRKPKFEKVNAHTIRIIIAKAEEIPLTKLLENKKAILEQKKQFKEQIVKQ